MLTSLSPMALSSHHFVTSSKTALVKVTNDVYITKSIANFQFSSTLINHQHDMLVHPIFLKTLSDLVSRTLLAAPPCSSSLPPIFQYQKCLPRVHSMGAWPFTTDWSPGLCSQLLLDTQQASQPYCSVSPTNPHQIPQHTSPLLATPYVPITDIPL